MNRTIERPAALCGYSLLVLTVIAGAAVAQVNPASTNPWTKPLSEKELKIVGIPEYPVPGTSAYVYWKETADLIAQTLKDAQAAVNSCSKEAYDASLKDLRAHAPSLSPPSRVKKQSHRPDWLNDMRRE